MAKLDLNGITLDEVKSNSSNAYAAGIDSGEIQKVVCRHSKKGNVVLSIEGKALYCKAFDGSNFTADGCILYNPPLTRCIVEACDNSENSIFIVKGTVTTTAPATTTSDTVVSKQDLQKEKEAADARLEAIETALKTA